MQTISRMYVNKAHFISMNSQLTEQLGLAKVAGTLSKSTEVMKIVNDLMRTPQLMQTMQQMSREMMKVSASSSCRRLARLHRNGALDEACSLEVVQGACC